MEVNLYDTKYGRFLLNPEDFVSKSMIKDGCWECDLFPIFDKYLNKDNVVIEIGSYIGDHTVYLSKLCEKVYAYEPQWNNYLQLCGNLFLNNCFNVVVENKAFGDGRRKRFVEETEKYYTNLEDNAAGKRLISDIDNNDLSTYRLDDTFRLFDKTVSLIKVDAEGMDLQILKHGYYLIKEDLPILIFEYNDLLAEANNETWQDYEDFIIFINYSLERIDLYNWLAVPKER